MSLKIDSLLRDRYRIKQLIAQSGMGTLYLARDEVLDVDIAIKENLYTTKDHSRQFHQEATILAKLRHPNLPRVIDHFVIDEMGEYLVMDYIEGQDLQEHLEVSNDPLPFDEVVRIGVSVCEALDYMHSRTPPIIHRDIKPANLKMAPDGQVLLVDFGLAKLYEQGEMTMVGAQGITAGYSPIEQYGQGTNACSDIYALAATLYTLLTVETPPEAIERAVGEDNLKPINQLNETLPESLQAVIEKAMAVKAEDRYQSAHAFKEALLKAHPLPGYSQNKTVVSPRPVLPQKEKSYLPVEPTLLAPKKKKKRLWVWMILGVILLGSVLVGGAILLLNSGLFSPATTNAPSGTDSAEIANLIELPTQTETLSQADLVPAVTITDANVAAQPTTTPQPVGTPQGGGRGQIAFVSERSGVPQIYLMNADGTGVEQLVSEADGSCQPEWSPDGMTLAYVSPCDGRKERYDNASIFILDIATGRSDLISTRASGDYDPAWSPDGTRLAFTSLQTGKPQIFIYEIQTGETFPFMSRATINRMPAWSPNGSQLVYVSPSPTTNLPVLFLVDSEGQTSPRVVLGGNYPQAFRPAWSPEGDLIVFDRGEEGQIGGRLFASNQDVPINTQLAIVENPSFSMDGQWLICNGVLDVPGHDIFLMLRTGARLTQLTDDPADDYQPVWRP